MHVWCLKTVVKFEFVYIRRYQIHRLRYGSRHDIISIGTRLQVIGSFKYLRAFFPNFMGTTTFLSALKSSTRHPISSADCLMAKLHHFHDSSYAFFSFYEFCNRKLWASEKLIPLQLFSVDQFYDYSWLFFHLCLKCVFPVICARRI